MAVIACASFGFGVIAGMAGTIAVLSLVILFTAAFFARLERRVEEEKGN